MHVQVINECHHGTAKAVQRVSQLWVHQACTEKRQCKGFLIGLRLTGCVSYLDS